MKEQAINMIEWLLKDVKTTPNECTEWQLNKIEGAIDFANSLNLISEDEFNAFYKKLLNIKINRH